jgi:predicted RNase H-like HicB family nuclease
MEFEGIIKRDRKNSLWLAEVKALDLMTQGDSKEDAILMLKDAITELLRDTFSEEASKTISLDVHFHGERTFGVIANDSKLLIALALRRKREQAGISIREVTNRLKVRSPNAYAQYEQGKVNISIDLFDRFLHAIEPSSHCSLRLA